MARASAFLILVTIDGGTQGQPSTCYPLLWVTHWVVGGQSRLMMC